MTGTQTPTTDTTPSRTGKSKKISSLEFSRNPYLQSSDERLKFGPLSPGQLSRSSSECQLALASMEEQEDFSNTMRLTLDDGAVVYYNLKTSPEKVLKDCPLTMLLLLSSAVTREWSKLPWDLPRSKQLLDHYAMLWSPIRAKYSWWEIINLL